MIARDVLGRARLEQQRLQRRGEPGRLALRRAAGDAVEGDHVARERVERVRGVLHGAVRA